MTYAIIDLYPIVHQKNHKYNYIFFYSYNYCALVSRIFPSCLAPTGTARYCNSLASRGCSLAAAASAAQRGRGSAAGGACAETGWSRKDEDLEF